MRRFFLLLSDIAVLYGSLALMIVTRYGGQFQLQFALHLGPFTAIFALWIVVLYIFDLYEPPSLRNTATFYSALLRAVTVAGALSVLFFYLLPVESITPKTNLALFAVYFLLVQAAVRSLFNGLIETRFQKSVMIVGLNPQSIELARFIKQNPQLGYFVLALADIGPEAPGQEDLTNFSIVRGTEHIAKAIRTGHVSTIVVSPEMYQTQAMIDIFYRSLEQRVDFSNLASFYERLTGRVPLGVINQIWFLENITEGSKRLYELQKRLTDVVLACLLGIVALVLLPLIVLAIALDSRGPVLYRQRRMGRAGKPFELIKFRTMIANDAHGGAEGTTGAVWTQQNDPRITRVGRVLRKMRIDELPQLWNILKGDMSFVGPRSERPEFHQMLTKAVPFYEERYLIKPGATGWAQLQKSYYSSVQDTMEKLQYDLYYIKNRSVVFDLGILLRTISLVLRGFGR